MNDEHGVEMSNNFQLEKSSYEQSGDASLILMIIVTITSYPWEV